ncbi:hypothetical protein ABZ890_11870 [Streptomyces sp. NPDC046984]|uniref:hypothetical protein n=1 Tax=Streptomyces sp. NPDC046984 TaxID=3155138 RepID=UPI00340706C2
MTAAEVTDTTGVPAVDTLVVWSLAAVAVAGALALAWRAARGLRRFVGRIDEFMDDWQGVPARPGVSERPGVMTRLDQIEGWMFRVEHELRPNGGSSLRDAVDRVDHRTQALAPDTEP